MYFSLQFYATVLIALFIFIIPIISDFLALRKTASLHDNLIYTAIKTVIYIAYPLFIIYFLDYIKTPDPNAVWGDFGSLAALNQGVVEGVAWFLLIGGMAGVIIAKYKALQFFEVKHAVLLCIIEIFYLPFLFVALLLALW